MIEALIERQANLLEKLQRIQESLDNGKECQMLMQPQTYEQILEDLMGEDNDVQRRLRDECIALGLTMWRLKRVPKDYYSWSLEERRDVLGAPSIEYLCKSMIMHNTKCVDEEGKYVLVVIVSII
jgi:hypothetical protein